MKSLFWRRELSVTSKNEGSVCDILRALDLAGTNQLAGIVPFSLAGILNEIWF